MAPAADPAALTAADLPRFGALASVPGRRQGTALPPRRGVAAAAPGPATLPEVTCSASTACPRHPTRGAAGTPRRAPALALAAALVAALPGVPRAEPAGACHCYQDRAFDPGRPAAADPYILATTRSSLLSAAFGVEKRSLVAAVMSGTPAGKGHFTTSWPNKVLKGDLSPAFMIDLAHKDLGIALDVANQLHVPMPLGAASREVYNQARAAGRGREDWTAILEQVRASAGLKKSH